jgi:hypothetical protein
MRNTELYFAQKFCWDHQIFVVVKTTPKLGRYKLAVSRAGREKIGEEVYESNGYIRTVEMISPTGLKTKHKIPVPPLHVKIAELYIDIYHKNTKHITENQLQAAG